MEVTMDAIIAWAIDNPELAFVAAGIMIDVIGGWLPDKYLKWPGLILSTAKKMYYNGKTEEPPEGRVIEDMVQRVIRRELSRYAKPKA
jgi:hypothetical protein